MPDYNSEKRVTQMKNKNKHRRFRNIIWLFMLLFSLVLALFLLIWAFRSNTEVVRNFFGFESTSAPTITPTLTQGPTRTPTLTPTPLPSSGIIVIDAGHGGGDNGCDAEDILEKDVTLKLALLLQKKLEVLDYQVYMTRTEDIYLSESQRVKLANDNDVDLLISLHLNSYKDDVSVNGIELLYGDHDGSKLLSDTLITPIIDNTGAKNRGTKENTDIWLLANTDMPSCMIQMGFVTNKNEFENIMDFIYQTELVQGIADGIDAYLNEE